MTIHSLNLSPAALSLLALAGIAFFVAAITRRSSWAYARKPLLSKAEQVVFSRLVRAFPQYMVFPQVSLAQAVAIRATGKQRRAALNRVQAKALDFLICTHEFDPIVAIELDDSSHDNSIQRKRDADKDRALNSAGVAVVRWRAGKVPGVIDMPYDIENAVGKLRQRQSKKAA